MKNEFLCASGRIRLDAEKQGRVFAELNGQCLHRFDPSASARPGAGLFCNHGGCSLWPAPEGGDYAFNYPDGTWCVQPGINSAPSHLLDLPYPACERTIPIRNRKGTALEMTLRRELSPVVFTPEETEDLLCTGYRSSDRLLLTRPCLPEEALAAAWTLEQFPGPAGVTAFGKVACPERAVNRNYYDDPGDALEFGNGFFRFHLEKEARWQIGVRASAAPEFIGAYDPSRELLILRFCEPGSGKRIDIADNDQKNGVFGEEDQFSIFCGGPVGFFELETIAPVTIRQGRVCGSELVSETKFYQGSREALEALLQHRYGLPQHFLQGGK